MRPTGRIIAFLKGSVKQPRYILLYAFLCLSVAATYLSFTLNTSVVPRGYSGNKPITFEGNGTVIYTEKSHQYSSNEWKAFKSDEKTAYLFGAWHIHHWNESGVNQKAINGTNAQKLLYELSTLKPTGESVSAVSDISGCKTTGTKWIQTKSKYFRIPNDREGVIYLMDKYGDYYGSGTVYVMTEDLKALVSELYNGNGENDTFSGDLEGEVLTVNMTYDGTNKNSLIFTDVMRNKTEEGKYSGGYVECIFTPSESGEYSLYYEMNYSVDNLGPRDYINFKAKAGQPVKIEIPLSNEKHSYNMWVKIDGISYYIYVHNH